MNFLRKHWFDLGGVFAVIVLIYTFTTYKDLTQYQTLMWFSLVSLFLHQFEEYRIPGTFPGMLNKVLYKSNLPDRYPLNPNSAFYINVLIGWNLYLLAALLSEKAIWLGIATILISLGNVIAHTFLFNIKGRTIYNAGMLTTWLLFVPCIYYFFSTTQTVHLATKTDYLIGIPLGIIMNVVGVLKAIQWMADEKTIYRFNNRNLLYEDRIQ